jgi:hypothetical protein
MASKFLLRLCPLCIKKHIVLLGPNDGARIFRRQHYHGAQNIIQLSTDHTLTVSRVYCLKKQFKDINNKKHGGPLRSQLIYSLSHTFIAPQDSPHCDEWSGAIKPILLKWCNKSYRIGNDAMVFKFMVIYCNNANILGQDRYFTFCISHQRQHPPGRDSTKHQNHKF